MKKILVAGAGHGGLTAAVALAKQGCDVTVCESAAREGMGHDWHDTMMPAAFDFCEIPRPENAFTPYVKARHTNPKKTVTLKTDPAPLESVAYIDRKTLIRYLLEVAEESGVRLCFETEVIGPICDNGRVTGLKLRAGGEEREETADLVIDAAGMDSPVRRNLPDAWGIKKEIPPAETYFVWRAYFNTVEGERPEHSYNICFFHTGTPGLDWLIDRPPYADILVGSIGSVNGNVIDAAVADFRRDYSFVGTGILRGGGEIRKIPLRRTLGLFVANGYAAVGDSACMTEPMNGSGITLSMKAGKLLADTVLAGGDAFASAENLWNYQYAYQKTLGERFLKDDLIKGMLGMLTAEDMDYLFEKRVLTAKEMLGAKTKTDLSFLLGKASLLGRPSLLPAVLKTAKRLAKKKGVCAAMPSAYDPAAVRAWAERYEAL